MCSDALVDALEQISPLCDTFSVSGQSGRSCLMRPAINAKRRIPRIVEVQSIGNLYIWQTELHWPQFGIELDGIYQQSIDTRCSYHFGQRFQYRFRLGQYLANP